MNTYKLIANPHAGGGRAARIITETVRILNARNVRHELEVTRGPKDAEAIAARACADPAVTAIVSIGGDGTLNEIVQKAVLSGKPLAVVPAGSGNDFSKMLKMPKTLDAVVDVVLAGRTRVIDAGRINNRYFINGVGFGFDAAVNYNTRSVRWITSGFAVYVLAFLKTLNKYRPSHMTVRINGETIERELFLVSVGNGTTCGGGFKLTPHAKFDDNLLDITIVTPLGLLQLFRHFPKVFLGTIDTTGHAITRRAPLLTVESPHPLPIQVDGEIFSLEGKTCEISVVPGGLTVIGKFDD